ncbi:MAG: transporter, partial [Chrysiogenales bacterium]
RDSILEGTYGPVYTRDYAHELGLTVSYGIIDPLDLVIGVPYGHVRSKESRILYAPPLPPGGYQGLRYKTTGTDTGIGDPVVELKWQFFQRDGLSLAVKPGATLPLGNEDAGFGTGCVSPFLYFILSYENGRFLTHLNFGYIRNQNNQNEREDLWHGSLALEFVLLDDWLRFIVNTGLERNPDTRSNYQDVFVLGGFVFSPSEYCDLDVGFKYSVALAGAESPGPDYAILCGVTVRFDGVAGRAGEDKKEGGK